MNGDAPIQIARVYDEPGDVTVRLLVDRVWPRGLTREALRIDEWIRDVGPSDELRKRFGHDPARWEEFQDRYCAELDANPAAVDRCLAWCERGHVTLLFSARDRERNQAVVLRGYLSERRKNGARND